jgi:mevalonate kinase
MTLYAGKLLLFGEYTTIRGSLALALPLPIYEGKWAQDQTDRSNYPPLISFIEFLEQKKAAQQLHIQLDLAKFRNEVSQGLYFKSNIPMGYGAGSSGALCAAVYDRFTYAPINRTDEGHFALLKKQLASLEAYFHGSSSGTDPLICYINRPALLEPSGHVKLVRPVASQNMPGYFFLIDTGRARHTAPLVKLFMEKCEDHDFTNHLHHELITYNELAINEYLSGARERLLSHLKDISAFQLSYFKEMIPEDFITIWQLGLDTGQFALKLCGAGGGGFLLGYSLKKPSELPLSDYTVITLDI